MTLDYFYNEKLHAYVVYLNEDDQIIHQPNDDLKNLTSFTETNNLELRYMTYLEFFDLKGANLCSTDKFPEPSNYTPPNLPTLEFAVGITCLVIFVLILLWIAFWSRQIYRRWKESKIEEFAFKHSKTTRQILFGTYLNELEVTSKELRVDQANVLRKGAFATVYLGHLKKIRNNELMEMDVAVKFPHIGASEIVRKDMINEIGLIKMLGSHENLLTMVRYVKSIENPVILTEYCSNGDLLSVLKKHKLHFMSPNRCQEVKICLLLKDLLRISLEICSGLIYLTSKGFIHRDVAARNVLLNDKLVAKLSDFGHCCQVDKETGRVYQKEGKFPIKHMSCEAIKCGLFSEKSDVWSFGILMVEMLSRGKKLFESLNLNEFIEFLKLDRKPEFCKDVPQKLVQILNNYCFQKEPDLRLTFVELEKELGKFYSIVLSVVE